MSRPKPERTMQSMDNVRLRVTRLREAAKLPYDRLAKKMEAAGCAIDKASLHKIEKGSPPRTIDVNELVAFAKVFGLTVEELLSDPDFDLGEEAARLFDEWRATVNRANDLRRQTQEVDEQAERIRLKLAALATKPGVMDRLTAAVERWLPPQSEGSDRATRWAQALTEPEHVGFAAASKRRRAADTTTPSKPTSGRQAARKPRRKADQP